jgi:hypothetical protein
MTGPIPVDLGRERDDCPARWHGTHSAYTNAGCTCPHARQAHNTWQREYRQARREGAPPRRLDTDPEAIQAAINGAITAAKLTTAERRATVDYLTRTRHMSDRDIAHHLHWSSDSRRGLWAVAQFRHRHHIPPGIPATHSARRSRTAA